MIFCSTVCNDCASDISNEEALQSRICLKIESIPVIILTNFEFHKLLLPYFLAFLESMKMVKMW